MAILDMKRIELLAMQSDRKALLEFIQQDGRIDISDMEDIDGLTKMDSSSTITNFEKWKQTGTQALEILNQYAPSKDGGGLLASFAPRPDMTLAEFTKKSEEADGILSKCQDIIALYKDVQDANVDVQRAQTQMDQLAPWMNLDIPSSFKGTATTAAFIGSIAAPMTREEVMSKIAEEYPDLDAEVEIVSSEGNMTCLVALCHKDNSKFLEAALRNIGFYAPTDPSKETPAQRMEALKAEVKHAEEVKAAAEEKLTAYGESRADINFLTDYLVLREDKYQALDKLSMTDRVFFLSGYIPAKYADATVKKLEKKFDLAVDLIDPDPETEDIPVAIENGTMGSTMENITNMYAPPSQRDVDPNLVMTIFYYSLFGMMLGDAGYGILMVIACLIVKFKFRLEPAKAKTVNYGLCCGIGTTVWGALMCGWFGDLPAYIANGLKPYTERADFIYTNHLFWFDPNTNTTRFLLLCFFIGILHLGLGLIINIVKQRKHEGLFNALVANVPQIMILIGVIPLINSQIGNGALAENHATKWIDDLIVSNSTILYGILAAGAALIILGPALIALKDRKPIGKVLGGIGGGLYDLYNAASGYLGDILSYARLLALGLCTGVIASVVNQLAAQIGNPVVFVIVCIFGHAVNFGINLIGTYVHTNRLQYVEFFGKFFEGGGKLYNPLTANSKTFKFKEEN